MSLSKPSSNPVASSLETNQTIGSFVSRRTGALIGSSILAVLATASAMVPYVVVFALATELFTHDSPDSGRILALALIALGGVALRALFSGLSNHFGHVTAYAILRDLRVALVAKLDRIPLARVRARSHGELKKTLHDDVEKLEEGLAHGIPDIASAATVPLVSAVILLVVDWRLGLLTIATVPVVFAIIAVGMKKSQANEIAEKAAVSALNSSMLGYLRGMKVIRGFIGTQAGTRDVREAIEQSRRAAELPVFNGRWPVSCGIVAMSLPIVVLVPATSLLYLNGSISLPILVLFILMGMGFNQPFFRLIGSIAALYWSVVLATESITAVFDEPELPLTNTPQRPHRYDITFDNVNFGYADDLVLHDINLSITEASMTAIVGPTGAGKTTLAHLIARFADPQQGTVRIGGIDVRQTDPAELMQIVSLVQQDDYIFDDTIIENIRLGRPDATDQEVFAAAERARVTAFAEELPGGWNTRLGAGGGRLSGGQRQRISVARALLKDSPIVILDEATAYLDADNEEAVTAAIAELGRGRTVIVVAHRLSSITHADRILVVDRGRVEAAGTHDELRTDSPLYARMWRAYQDTAGWRLESDSQVPVAPVNLGPLVASTETDGSVTEGLVNLGFFRQWSALLGERGRRTLLRDGLWRMVAEGILRAAPIWVVFITLISAVTGSLSAPKAWLAGGLLLLALALRAVALASVNRVLWSNAARSIAETQTLIVDRLLRVPLGFFTRYDAGRLTTLVANEVRMLDFQNTPSMIVAALIQPLVASTVLVVLDWRLALAALVGVPAFLVMVAWGDRIYHRVSSVLIEQRAATASALIEHVRGTAVLRAYPDAPQAHVYTSAVEQLRSASVGVSVKASPALTLGSAALELGFVALLLVGSQLFTAGQLTPVTLLVFLVIALVFYAPLQELGELSGYRRNQQQVARRIAEVWDAPILDEPATARIPQRTDVHFDAVDFAYGDNPALREVEFTAPQGKITALVGASGAGKSTLANLVARFWDVDRGAVRIGSVDVREIGSEALVSMVTTVYQEVFLFNDTVRRNVVIGNPQAAEADIIAALQAAQCDFVFELPEGLDTKVGENGALLSGGQRQRLSIARALLQDSPILVLDEAVASVDPETEARIQAAMSHLARGRTVLVVAHRLGTIKGADHIVVLDQGRVDGAGRHADLLQSSEAYRRLWAAHERANQQPVALPVQRVER